MARRNPVVQRRSDDEFVLVLPDEHRQALIGLLDELEELLEEAPDDPSTRRLHPPAYLDDPERDLGYQILAGDELRTSRRAAISSARAALERQTMTESDLWSWAQALNSIRLVVGTRLGIDDDDHLPPDDPDHPDAPLWDVLEFCGEIQFFVVSALGS